MTSQTHTYYILKDDMRIIQTNECTIENWRTLTGCVIVKLLNDTKYYLAHTNEPTLKRISAHQVFYIRALNANDKTYDISKGVFAVRSRGTCTLYNIINGRIYHEQHIRQAIWHILSADITIDSKYAEVRASLASKYPDIHADIFDEIIYDIHDMRVVKCINAIIEEKGGSVSSGMMDTALRDVLVKASQPPPVVVATLTKVSNPVTNTNTQIRVIRPVVDKPIWNGSTNLKQHPNRTGGVTTVFEPQDKELFDNKKTRREFNPQFSAKKNWPSTDYTYAPIFYMLSGIDVCIPLLSNQNKFAMCRMCEFIIGTGDQPNDLAAAIAELETILNGVVTQTPIQKINKIFEALNITNSRYVISDSSQTPPIHNNIPSGVVSMSAYITDDTYTDVENSKEYKGAECYSILIGDNYEYPKNACFMYAIDINDPSLHANIQERE